MNLTDVLLTEGKVLKTKADYSKDSFDLKWGHFPIAQKSPVDLTITNKGNKVLALQGSGDFTVLIPCDRCLTDVKTPIHIEFDEEIDMKLSDEARTDALDESVFLHGYNLDVDRLVDGEALLVWPSRVLCREECKGLCKVCGQNLNLKMCDCDQTSYDPRMAKIRDIFNSIKEV